MSLVSPRMKRPTMLGGSKHKRKIDFTLNSSNNNNNNDDDDDSVSSHEDDYVSDSSGSSSEEEEETVDAKRIRLAREYLRKMEEKDDDGSEEEDDEKKEEDKLSKRLEEDRLKRMGKWQEPVADRMEELLSSEDGGSRNTVQYLRGPHDLTVTCVALSSNQQYMYSGSKDHSIAMWDTSTQKLHTVIQPCWNKSQKSKSNTNNNNDDDDDDATTRQGGQVLCMDCQDSYLAIGTRDAILSIYNSSTGKRMERFKGHSKAITCLTFLSSNIVMTGSEDRCIRQVSLEQMAHVETLYGHQAAVSSISSAPTGGDDKPMSVGRDRTARVWKLQEESHLIFRGGATMAPADTIAAMNDNKHFLTGHEDGTLAMWNTAKKRPIYTTKTTNNNYPITSLVIHTDLAITGSHDGQLRFWKLDHLEGTIKAIGQISILGYINDIVISKNATFCVLALGQEPKLGRWNRVPKAKNRCVYIPLLLQQQQKHLEEENTTTSNNNSEDDEDSNSDEESDNEMDE